MNIGKIEARNWQNWLEIQTRQRYSSVAAVGSLQLQTASVLTLRWEVCWTEYPQWTEGENRSVAASTVRRDLQPLTMKACFANAAVNGFFQCAGALEMLKEFGMKGNWVVNALLNLEGHCPSTTRLNVKDLLKVVLHRCQSYWCAWATGSAPMHSVTCGIRSWLQLGDDGCNWR